VLAGLPASTHGASLCIVHKTRLLDLYSTLTGGRTSHQQLHWLPVKYRIIFKIATLMYHSRYQSYLVDLVAFNTADS